MPQFIGLSPCPVHSLNTGLIQCPDINIQPSADAGYIFHILRLIRHNGTPATCQQNIGHIIHRNIIRNIVDQRYIFPYNLNTIPYHYYLLSFIRCKKKADMQHRHICSLKPSHPAMVSLYPYVGIIQIRLRVRDQSPTLSLPAQAPLLFLL